mgnify:CR=1 FL=1
MNLPDDHLLSGAADTAGKHADLNLTHHLAVGLGCVVLIALAGACVVFLARRYGFAQRPGRIGANSFSPLRVLQVRRVAPGLRVFVVRVSSDRAVVVADNGRALEKLCELPLSQEEQQT